MKTEFIATYKSAPLRELMNQYADGVVVPFPETPSDTLHEMSPADEALWNFMNTEWFADRRYKLEEDTTNRHPIAYGVVAQHREGNWEVFVYQRTKVTGEGRLAGKHSIGIGGHIEASDIFNEGHEHNLLTGIVKGFVREVAEEFTFDGLALDVDTSDVKPSLLIHSDEGVDEFHLGIVPIIILPKAVDYTGSNEPDQVAIGFMTLEQIQQGSIDTLMESWSNKILTAVFEQLNKI